MPPILRCYSDWLHRTQSTSRSVSQQLLTEQNSLGWYFVVLLIPIGIVSWPFAWTANEENYFQLAYARVMPDQFGPFAAVFDANQSRFLTEWFIGLLVQWLGYDSAHTAARLINLFGLSLGFSLVFRQLRISPLIGASALLVFALMDQQFMGGEWIIGGVEGKTFAYIMALVACYLALVQRHGLSLFCLVLATYFHFLVGGFFFLVWSYWHFSQHKSFRSMALHGAAFVSAVAPLLLILISDQFTDISGDQQRQASELYSWRNKHHIAPFQGMGQLLKWGGGIALTTCTFLFLWLNPPSTNSRLKTVHHLLTILTAYLILAVTISFFDRHTMLFAKFYLFRPSSFIVLAVITYLLYRWSEQLPTTQRATSGSTLLFFCLYALIDTSIHNLRTQDNEAHKVRPVIEAVTSHTQQDDLILLQQPKEKSMPWLTLHRQLDNPTLVSWKFVPTSPVDILEWKKRLDFSASVFAGHCDKPMDYPVKYLLAFDQSAALKLPRCAELIWDNRHASLWKIGNTTQ